MTQVARACWEAMETIVRSNSWVLGAVGQDPVIRWRLRELFQVSKVPSEPVHLPESVVQTQRPRRLWRLSEVLGCLRKAVVNTYGRQTLHNVSSSREMPGHETTIGTRQTSLSSMKSTSTYFTNSDYTFSSSPFTVRWDFKNSRTWWSRIRSRYRSCTVRYQTYVVSGSSVL